MFRIYRPTPPIYWDFLRIQGPDAADFLHRLTTVNVKSMQPGSGAPGFFLTAQGKIRAYFVLWRKSKEEFFLELDAGASSHWKKELLDVIEQFHFGEKFTVESAAGSDLSCIWILGDEAGSIVEAGRSRELEGSLRAFNHGLLDFGTPWITAWGTRERIEAWIRTLETQLIGFDELERMRMAVARPRVDTELTLETNPLDAGLRDAISDNKGCYPGQEVIEKIISLGSPARRLVKFEGSGPAPSTGEPILATPENTEVGKVTSVMPAERGGFHALGFVRKTHAKEGIEVTFGQKRDSRARVVFVPKST